MGETIHVSIAIHVVCSNPNPYEARLETLEETGNIGNVPVNSCKTHFHNISQHYQLCVAVGRWTTVAYGWNGL
jgi:hypothetical protein